MIPLDELVVLMQFIFATLNLGAVDPNNLPDVRAVSNFEMAAAVCEPVAEAQKDACMARASHLGAAYVPAKKAVYYNAMLIKPMINLVHRSYLIHELVHFTQGPVDNLTCDQLKQREIEAYHVQDAFLRANEQASNFEEKFKKVFKCND